MSELKVNVGCWKWKIPGFVNVDIDPSVNPDLVADGLKLPYEKELVDEIYAGHLIEHLHPSDLKPALEYWKGLLKPGGRITVTVPDFEKAYDRWKEGLETFGLLHSVIFGELGRLPNRHMNIFNEKILHDLLAEYFVDLETLGYCKYWAGTVPWQTTITCRKAGGV